MFLDNLLRYVLPSNGKKKMHNLKPNCESIYLPRKKIVSWDILELIAKLFLKTFLLKMN